MVSYFDLISVFAFSFFILTIVNIPVMKIYADYDNYSSDALESNFKVFSMGNMGFAGTKCVNSGMAANQILLSCQTGSISNIQSYGINSKKENMDNCVTNTTGQCAGAFDTTMNTLMNSCIGKESCWLTGLKSKIIKNNATCTDEDAHFYVQYYCSHSDAEIQKRLHLGSYIGSISVFACLFFLIMIYYLKNQVKIKHIDWDVATTTAGDYTVDMVIPLSFYNRFL